MIYLRGNEAAGGEGAVGFGPRTSPSLGVADRWLFVCGCVCLHACVCWEGGGHDVAVLSPRDCCQNALSGYSSNLGQRWPSLGGGAV